MSFLSYLVRPREPLYIYCLVASLNFSLYYNNIAIFFSLGSIWIRLGEDEQVLSASNSTHVTPRQYSHAQLCCSIRRSYPPWRWRGRARGRWRSWWWRQRHSWRISWRRRSRWRRGRKSSQELGGLPCMVLFINHMSSWLRHSGAMDLLKACTTTTY